MAGSQGDHARKLKCRAFIGPGGKKFSTGAFGAREIAAPIVADCFPH
jgi:hypothetical protein